MTKRAMTMRDIKRVIEESTTTIAERKSIAVVKKKCRDVTRK